MAVSSWQLAVGCWRVAAIGDWWRLAMKRDCVDATVAVAEALEASWQALEDSTISILETVWLFRYTVTTFILLILAPILMWSNLTTLKLRQD